MQTTPTAYLTQPVEQRIDDNLTLRSLRDERDIERCVAFVSIYVRETSGITTERVLHHFPTMTPDRFLFVEDLTSGEVVSTTCLIPWQCRFGTGPSAVTWRVAMLEVVATHPDYRKRGLIRTQMAAFHAAVQAGGFDFSIIEGIPYYYRQFGYTYATDHAVSDAVSSGRIPDLPPTVAPVHLRAATLADIPQLIDFYNATYAALDIATLRDEALWHYVLIAAEHPVYLVERVVEESERRAVGYICAWRQPNGDLRIAESGIPAADDALALLHFCKGATSGEIYLRWPQESALVQVARGLGGAQVPSNQWLIRIHDPQHFLATLSPRFAERLAHSPYAGWTGEVTVNLFRQAFALRFAAGELQEVEALGFVDASMGADGGDLCIPPDAFVRLVMGYRTLEELMDAWPDIVVRPTRRHLLDTLLPKCRAYFSMPYFYYGKMERIW
jgi:GNAT superfamily N-acetyltransferase